MTLDDMTARSHAPRQRAILSRIAAALCIAGMMSAGGLSLAVASARAAGDPIASEQLGGQPAEGSQGPTGAPSDGADSADAGADAAGGDDPQTTTPAPVAPAPAQPALPAPTAPSTAPAGSPKPITDSCVATDDERAERATHRPSPDRPGDATPGRATSSSTNATANAATKDCPRSRRERNRRKVRERKPRERQPRSPHPARDRARATPTAPPRATGGSPAASAPSSPLASSGALPAGVPNFFIDEFRIPPFLLPIYQAAGIQYDIRWEVLAAINEIETDYGRNLNISSAGALGWMQFMPGTWKAYGVDANGDGRKDPLNPVDAIFAAARYLRAAGADKNLRKAIFAYNHADWYVDSVLARARMIGGLPADLIGSLNGLTQGHFPVHARARYADAISERDLKRRLKVGTNAALPVESDGARRGIDIRAAEKSRVIAVQDGTIIAIGKSKRLGSYVRLRDVHGNTYTYGNLGSVATQVAVPKRRTQSKASIAKELELPKRDPKPTRAASAGRQVPTKADRAATRADAHAAAAPRATGVAKERLFAHPTRRNALANGGAQQVLDSESALDEDKSLRAYITGSYGLDRNDVVLKSLVRGRRVIAGTVLGRIGDASKARSPHLAFEIRPAGRGAPRIDPKPVLDGWKLLESTSIYRAKGKRALLGPDAPSATIGQIMLMSKETLIRRVLANPRIEVYSCGRRDIAAGIVDRRVLATLEFLAGSGLEPTVTSLTCGHGRYTSSGNVSAHSSGNAIDIAKVNGIPIRGHQGKGSITDVTIHRLLALQGTAKPDQIISLNRYAGAHNTLAMGDHDDHIHVGFRPQLEAGSDGARGLESVLKPSQWTKLIARLGRVGNPTVRVKPSRYAIRVPVRRASRSHRGE